LKVHKVKVEKEKYYDKLKLHKIKVNKGKYYNKLKVRKIKVEKKKQVFINIITSQIKYHLQGMKPWVILVLSGGSITKIIITS